MWLNRFVRRFMKHSLLQSGKNDNTGMFVVLTAVYWRYCKHHERKSIYNFLFSSFWKQFKSYFFVADENFSRLRYVVQAVRKHHKQRYQTKEAKREGCFSAFMRCVWFSFFLSFLFFLAIYRTWVLSSEVVSSANYSETMLEGRRTDFSQVIV